jgi:tellurite methyltransferase
MREEERSMEPQVPAMRAQDYSEVQDWPGYFGAVLGKSPCDLVNASFALPFCEPRHFPELWTRIVAAIRPGGRFAGLFFGDRDSWASLPDRTHHSQDEVVKLLQGFEIEMMRTEERDDQPDVRNPKHWQLFHVVARKQ